MKKPFVLLPFILILLVGCGDSNKPPSVPSKTQSSQPKSAIGHQAKNTVQTEPPVFRLSELWGASKSEVKRALHGHKLTESDAVPQDYPDPMAAGGEIRAYDLGGGTEFSATFNSKGYATILCVVNESGGLGFTLEQWHKAFQRYGLQECGEPAKTAPQGYYWGPPHNHTGGFEIEIFSDEKRQVWQVQVRSPDDFFPD